MQFAVLMWVSDNTKVGSVFGVVDDDKRGPLPNPSAGGHWAGFRTIDDTRFKFAEDAKRAIARHGYYLMGAGISIDDAFGRPSN